MTETELILAQYFLNTANAWVMLIWAVAYYAFSGGLWYVESRLKTRVFGEHIAGVRRFVAWCAHSHLCMFAIMLEHVRPHSTEYNFWIHTIGFNVFLVGGIYSLYRAYRLWSHVPQIISHFDELIDAINGKE